MRVFWQETVTDAPGSKSTVAITKVQLASESYVGDTYYADFKIEINGTTVATIAQSQNYTAYLANFNQFYDVTKGGTQITGSVGNISHDAQGNASVNITLKPNGFSYAGFWRTGAHFAFTTTSVSKAINLYQIPVGTLSISADTGSTISVTRGGTSISAGANLWYGQSLVITFAASTGYQLDSHTVNGSNFNSGGTHTVTGNVAVATTASRSVSTIATGNGTFGTAQTITVTRYITGATHTIKAVCAGQTQTIVTNSSSLSISWTPSVSIMNYITNAMSASCVLTITTYSNGSTIGSYSITVTLSLPTTGTYDVDPTPTITDSDANGYKTTMGGYVKGKSALSVAISDGLKYSATTASRSTTANGVTSAAASFNAGILSANTTISASVTDSRGRTGTASKSISVLAYSSPKIVTFSVHRTDQYGVADDMGDYFVVTWAINITALNNNNTKSLKLKYKRVSLSTWTEQTITLNSYTDSGSTSAIAASGDYSWDVQLVLADYFEPVTKATKLSTAAVVESRRPQGKGVAFSKVAETDGAFDIGSWSAMGRVLGLGQARAQIPANASIADYTEPGVYGVNDTAASSIADCPSSYGGTLRVWNSIGSSSGPGDTWYYVLQEYNDRYQNTWRRYGASGSGTTVNWYAWSFYAGQLSDLKDQLGLPSSLHFDYKSASNGNSVSWTFSGAARGAVIVSSATSNAHDIVIYNFNSGGSGTKSQVRNATGITVTATSGVLTIQNSSGVYIYCLQIAFG